MLLSKNNQFDTSLEALTPEGIKFFLIPSGLPVRTLAYMIDVIAQWMILTAIYTIWALLLHWQFGFWIFLLLNFCIDWFYHVICELLFQGRSIGKRLTGIRVVKGDGSPVDMSASFLRNLLRFADTFCYFFPIAFLSMSVSSGFRRIGDWAGNTMVVYTQTGSIKKNITGYLSKYAPIVPPFTLSYDEKQAILNFARRYALLGESRANEIAGIYAPYLREANAHTAGDAESSVPPYPANAEPSNAPQISNAEYLLGIARHLSGESASPDGYASYAGKDLQ